MKRWVGDMPSPAHSPQVPCPVHGAWTACCLFAVTLFRMPHVVSCIASPQQAAAGCQHGGAFVNATYSPARCVVPPPGVFGVCRGKLVGMANLADRTTPPAVPPYLVKALGLAPHLAAWRARQHSGAPRVALPGDLEQLLVGEVEGRDSLAALLTVRGQTRLWQGGGAVCKGATCGCTRRVLWLERSMLHCQGHQHCHGTTAPSQHTQQAAPPVPP